MIKYDIKLTMEFDKDGKLTEDTVDTFIVLLESHGYDVVKDTPTPTMGTESKPETPAKPKPTPTKPKVTPKPKKDVEKPVEKKEQGITLANLKDRAKEKAQSAGREEVKKVISNYAPKLTEVSEEDYGKIYKALGELA